MSQINEIINEILVQRRGIFCTCFGNEPDFNLGLFNKLISIGQENITIDSKCVILIPIAGYKGDTKILKHIPITGFEEPVTIVIARCVCVSLSEISLVFVRNLLLLKSFEQYSTLFKNIHCTNIALFDFFPFANSDKIRVVKDNNLKRIGIAISTVIIGGLRRYASGDLETESNAINNAKNEYKKNGIECISIDKKFKNDDVNHILDNSIKFNEFIKFEKKNLFNCLERLKTQALQILEFCITSPVNGNDYVEQLTYNLVRFFSVDLRVFPNNYRIRWSAEFDAKWNKRALNQSDKIIKDFTKEKVNELMNNIKYYLS